MVFHSAGSVFKAKTRAGGAVFFSLLIIFGMLLSACGSSSTSHNNQNSALTIQPEPDGDYTQAFSPFDPTSTPGTQGMVYEPLLMYNVLNGSVKPWLATSYQFSAQNKILTFQIRQNVKWSDGEPFTADDVAFTFNLLKKYPAADTNALWQSFQSVVATSKYTVTITLKKADPPILYYAGGLTYMVPQHIFASVGDPTKFVNAKPVGTGPYMLDQFTPQLVTYKKNPSYWQPGKPQVSELRYPAYDSNQSVELDLDQGNLDWTNLFTPNVAQTFVKRDPTTNHYWFPPSSVIMLYLNLTKAPFNQLPVRQAISDVLDHEQMYKVAEDGYEPVASPTGLILPNQKSYLDPAYANLMPTVNMAKATQLMQSAGYTKKVNGIYVDKSGKPLSFNLDVVTGWTDWVTMCQIIASNLKAFGINATVNAIAYNSYVSNLQTGNYDMAVSWSTTGPTPYYFYNSLLSSKNTAPIGQSAPTNWERWQSASTDNLLDQYATTTDPKVQQQAISSLEQTMVQQVPSIPLVYGANFYEYSTAHFTGWPDQNNPFAVPTPETVPDCEAVVLNLKPV